MHPDLIELHAKLEDVHWWFVGRRRIIAELVHALVPPDRGAIVCDVGCGTGATVGALLSGYGCIGIDRSPEAVRLASIRFPGATFLHGSPPADHTDAIHAADVVLLMDVLEHVEQDAELLHALVRVTRPRAHLVVTVPADPRLWSPHDDRFGHHRRYEPQTLAALWRGCPVSPLVVSHFNARLYPLARAVRAAARRRGRSSGEAGTDLRLPPKPVNALLARVFAGEAEPLRRALTRGASAYHRGLSLLAVLRREA
ncbi:MAG TPA: methyltransferase domain-containing protein [Gemmatimonadaceae bacterium]|nr:methyltransferase domain-containing protein [Gemmatimonadaceae bacterium]